MYVENIIFQFQMHGEVKQGKYIMFHDISGNIVTKKKIVNFNFMFPSIIDTIAMYLVKGVSFVCSAAKGA